MNTLAWARALMGVSLAFHIVYATIGIGLPAMLMVAEGAALRTGQEVYHRLARRWVRQSSVLFAIGAVSGTVLSFELGLLWPGFMRAFGEAIGLPFALEGFAFFTEAIFLGIYLYGRGKVSPRLHLASGIVVAISGAASGVKRWTAQRSTLQPRAKSQYSRCTFSRPQSASCRRTSSMARRDCGEPVSLEPMPSQRAEAVCITCESVLAAWRSC